MMAPTIRCCMNVTCLNMNTSPHCFYYLQDGRLPSVLLLKSSTQSLKSSSWKSISEILNLSMSLSLVWLRKSWNTWIYIWLLLEDMQTVNGIFLLKTGYYYITQSPGHKNVTLLHVIQVNEEWQLVFNFLDHMLTTNLLILRLKINFADYYVYSQDRFGTEDYKNDWLILQSLNIGLNPMEVSHL